MHQYYVLPEFIWLDWTAKDSSLEGMWTGLQDGLYYVLAKRYLKKALLSSLPPKHLHIIFERVLSRFGHDFNRGS